MSTEKKITKRNSGLKLKRGKKIALFLAAFLILGCTQTKYGNNVITAQAHSGRTDSQGGHRDNKNKSGLGSYHYHHGYSAHLHPGGICPYDNNSNSNATSTKQNSSAPETKSEAVLKAEDYKLIFESTYYYNNNPDLQTTIGSNGQKLLEHFVNNGMAEGRRGCSTFDVKVYKDNNSDLAALYGDDLKKYYEHYMNCGYNEQRVAY